MFDSTQLRKLYAIAMCYDHCFLYFSDYSYIFIFDFHRQDEKYRMWCVDTIFIIWLVELLNVIYTCRRLNCIQMSDDDDQLLI